MSEALVFAPGLLTRMCVDLPITNDIIGEFDEFLTLSLSTGPTATVTIIDDGERVGLSH